MLLVWNVTLQATTVTYIVAMASENKCLVIKFAV